MKFKTPLLRQLDWVAVRLAAERCAGDQSKNKDLVAAIIKQIFAAIDKRKLRAIKVTIGSQVCEYVLLHQCRQFFEKVTQ